MEHMREYTTQQEIEDELAYVRELISNYRKRLRSLQLQESIKGSSTPAETVTEIGDLHEKIQIQEDELTKLKSLAVEGQLSLAEAEYRVVLAETWNTFIGRPTAYGMARLELARLKLGLKPERAKELETEIRIVLVKEIFMNLDIAPILGQKSETPVDIGPITITCDVKGEGSITINHIDIDQSLVINDSMESVLQLIGRAIRLDPLITGRLLLQTLPETPSIDFNNFRQQLLSVNKVWINQDEQKTFEAFVDGLATDISE